MLAMAEWWCLVSNYCVGGHRLCSCQSEKAFLLTSWRHFPRCFNRPNYPDLSQSYSILSYHKLLPQPYHKLLPQPIASYMLEEKNSVFTLVLFRCQPW